MDPLSVAASIAGLLSLTLQLVQLGNNYSHKLLRAQLYEFMFELRALKDVLELFQEFLNDPNTDISFGPVSVLISTNTRCETLLKDVLEKLQKTILEPRKVVRLVDKVLWPLNDKEHRQSIEQIHRYVELYNFALTTQGCSLLSGSTREVRDALIIQCQKLEDIKKQCGPMQDLSQLLSRMADIQTLLQDMSEESQKVVAISSNLQTIERVSVMTERFLDERERSKILSWLSPATFESKQRQLQAAYVQGTGNWLLKNDVFCEWRSRKPSALWCTGIPGAGKTILASLVADTMKCARSGVAFIFADYSEANNYTAANLLSSITRQLAGQSKTAMELVHLRHSSTEEQNPLTFQEHLELLNEISKKLGHIHLIIDAVDELPTMVDSHRSDIRAELLNAIASMGCVSVFYTARPHIDRLLYAPSSEHLVIEARDEDLREFINHRISSSHRLSKRVAEDSRLREQIFRQISAKAAGSFLLARLQVDQVADAAVSARHIREALGELSGLLDETYRKTIDRIRSQSQLEADIALRAISWVANVKRPLTVPEFMHALSLRKEDKYFDTSGLLDVDLIIETCSGLLQIQPAAWELRGTNGPFERDDTVGFVHYTTQEYVNSLTKPLVDNVHGDIASTCLSYLCLKEFELRTRPPRTSYPFIAYAAPFWPAHARVTGEILREDLLKDLISEFRPQLSRNWLQYALQSELGSSNNPQIPVGFAAAVLTINGAISALRLVLNSGVRVNVRYRGTLSPLKVAFSSSRRYDECMDMLMRASLRESTGSFEPPLPMVLDENLERHVARNPDWLSEVLDDCRKLKCLDLLDSFLDHNSEVTDLILPETRELLDDSLGTKSPHSLVIMALCQQRRLTSDLVGIVIVANDLPFLKLLVENGLSSNHFASFESPLVLSIRNRQLPIARYLIEKGIFPIKHPAIRHVLEWFLQVNIESTNKASRLLKVVAGHWRREKEEFYRKRPKDRPWEVTQGSSEMQSVPTFPWLTTSTLSYICRHVDMAIIEELRQAIVKKGVRPIDYDLLAEQNRLRTDVRFLDQEFAMVVEMALDAIDLDATVLIQEICRSDHMLEFYPKIAPTRVNDMEALFKDMLNMCSERSVKPLPEVIRPVNSIASDFQAALEAVVGQTGKYIL